MTVANCACIYFFSLTFLSVYKWSLWHHLYLILFCGVPCLSMKRPLLFVSSRIPGNLAIWIVAAVRRFVSGSADRLVLYECILDVLDVFPEQTRVVIIVGVDAHAELHTASDDRVDAVRIITFHPDDDRVTVYIADQKVFIFILADDLIR